MAIAEKKAEKEKKKIVKSGKKAGNIRRRGQYPTKRTINLAAQGEQPVRLALAIPSIILIILAAAVLSKFMVYDRFAEVSRAQNAVAELQAQVNAGYAALADYNDIAEQYAHYTYSGFNTEELGRCNRVDIMKLIRTTVLPWAEVSNWTVNGNVLTIRLSGESLQQLNLIAQQLTMQEIVDYCTVNTANTNNTAGRNTNKDEPEYVTGQIQVYLNAGAGVNRG